MITSNQSRETSRTNHIATKLSNQIMIHLETKQHDLTNGSNLSMSQMSRDPTVFLPEKFRKREEDSKSMGKKKYLSPMLPYTNMGQYGYIE